MEILTIAVLYNSFLFNSQRTSKNLWKALSFRKHIFSIGSSFSTHSVPILRNIFKKYIYVLYNIKNRWCQPFFTFYFSKQFSKNCTLYNTLSNDVILFPVDSLVENMSFVVCYWSWICYFDNIIQSRIFLIWSNFHLKYF